MSPDGVNDTTPHSMSDLMAQLLSLTSQLIDFCRHSPHVGNVERDWIATKYEEEYFALSRSISKAFRHRNY